MNLGCGHLRVLQVFVGNAPSYFLCLCVGHVFAMCTSTCRGFSSVLGRCICAPLLACVVSVCRMGLGVSIPHQQEERRRDYRTVNDTKSLVPKAEVRVSLTDTIVCVCVKCTGPGKCSLGGRENIFLPPF